MNQDGSGDDPEGSGEDGALIGNAEEKPSGTNTPNLFKLFGSMGGSLQPPDEFFGGRQNLPEEQLRNNGKSGQQKKEKPQYKFLSLYSVDLTERAALGGIDNIVGREREIERIIPDPEQTNEKQSCSDRRSRRWKNRNRRRTCAPDQPRRSAREAA